jgi:hypothetical protein
VPGGGGALGPAEDDPPEWRKEVIEALLFDADGNGGGVAVQFASIGTGLSLGATDFVVI